MKDLFYMENITFTDVRRVDDYNSFRLFMTDKNENEYLTLSVKYNNNRVSTILANTVNNNGIEIDDILARVTIDSMNNESFEFILMRAFKEMKRQSNSVVMKEFDDNFESILKVKQSVDRMLCKNKSINKISFK